MKLPDPLVAAIESVVPIIARYGLVDEAVDHLKRRVVVHLSEQGATVETTARHMGRSGRWVYRCREAVEYQLGHEDPRRLLHDFAARRGCFTPQAMQMWARRTGMRIGIPVIVELVRLWERMGLVTVDGETVTISPTGEQPTPADFPAVGSLPGSPATP